MHIPSSAYKVPKLRKETAATTRLRIKKSDL
jgi:hypothetical protein